MNYKLFITDLDGTLLNKSLQIPPGNLKAIQKLVNDKHIPVTVFTGRNYNSAIDFVEELGVNVPVVFQNGALILEISTKKEYFRKPLTSALAFEMATSAKKFGFDVVCFDDFYAVKDIYLEREIWIGHPFHSYFDNNMWRTHVSEDILDHIMNKADIAQLAIVGQMESLLPFKQRLQSTYHDKISCIISTVKGDYGFLEIFGPGVSKAEAFKVLTEHYGVSAAETVFIGDGYNDVEIMKLVGMPVAMGNAPKEVQDLCKLVVNDNENCGVADAIERLFFK